MPLNLILAQAEVLAAMGATDTEAVEKAQKIAGSIEEWKSLSFQDMLQRLAESAVSFVINLAIAIVVFYVGRFIIRKLNKLLTSIFVRRKVEASLASFILSLVKMVLYFILVITVIGILGIETTSFIAIFASAGVAIGMALSGTLQNFAGGVLILLMKPYKIGDYIEAQGYAGTVKEIQIFFTLIRTPDNKIISIPNGGLSSGSVNNWSREPFRRVQWTVSISYGDDVEKARTAILQKFASDQRIVTKGKVTTGNMLPPPNPEPKVLVSELASSSVDLTVRAWVRTSDYWDVYYEYNELFYNLLPKSGVNFPFPQLDVHLQNQ